MGEMPVRGAPRRGAPRRADLFLLCGLAPPRALSPARCLRVDACAVDELGIGLRGNRAELTAGIGGQGPRCLEVLPKARTARGIELRLLSDQPSEILRLGRPAESLGAVLDNALEVVKLLLHELRKIAMRGVVHASSRIGHDPHWGTSGHNTVRRLLGGPAGGFDDGMAVVSNPCFRPLAGTYQLFTNLHDFSIKSLGAAQQMAHRTISARLPRVKPSGSVGHLAWRRSSSRRATLG